LRLLYTAAHWHALAKLRLHNDFTLDILDSETRSFGQELRDFNHKTCPAFTTRELPREYAARIRRNTKKPTAAGRAPRHEREGVDDLAGGIVPTPQFSHTPESARTQADAGNMIVPLAIIPTHIRDPFIQSTAFLGQPYSEIQISQVHPSATAGITGTAPPDHRTGGVSNAVRPTNESRQLKSLNLNTYKIHALGDYVSAIRTYGTTDSYSTETVSRICAIHRINL
jgi:hypothetical protein